MKYKLFGKSGLRVSELCLGAMTFGEEWGWGASKEESKRILDAFLDRGGNFVDTANRYMEGTSEVFLGEFVQGIREKVVLATKYTLTMRPDDPNGSGNQRKNLVQSLEASLKRLRTDYVDVLWLHAWDYRTPVEEVMRGLDDVVRAGKTLYVGISDAPAWVVSRANTLAELRGWTAFTGLQIEYSLVERSVERELLPMARALDLAVTAWAPLGAGLLTGKFGEGRERPKEGEARLKPESRKLNETNLAIGAEVDKVAASVGRPSSQVALAWLRQKRGNIIPIVGARRLSQVEENLGCVDLVLGEEEMARLDEASGIELGFPHDFLAQDHIRGLVLGEKRDRIESHRPDWLP